MPNIDDLFRCRLCGREINCSPSRVRIAVGGGGPPRMALSNDEGEALETSIVGAPGYCLLAEAPPIMFKACSLIIGAVQ
jgi:hypothetical protein